jgi:mRNA interferase YafQ
MLDVFYSAQFKRDYKRMGKQGRDLDLLLDVVDVLAAETPLDEKYKDHPLSGNLIGHRECHILPDWLLVYKPEKNRLVLTLTRTGSHSELFGK